MKSWACLYSYSNVAGRGRVSNIGCEAPMWRLDLHYTRGISRTKRCKNSGKGNTKEEIKEKGMIT